MADGFIQFLLKNLNSLMQNQLGLLFGVDKEMKKLSSTLSTIQAVLEDAEQRREHKDKAIQDWLKKLKDAAYEVDDILDDCETQVLRIKSKGQRIGFLEKVSTSLLTCYPVENTVFRHKIGNRMKDAVENLNAIAEERLNFHLREAVGEKRNEFAERRETSSVLIQPQLYGRDEDKEKIVKMLVDFVCDCQEVSVYTIIGMGGLGKTTLAQMTFNDDRVKCHFELSIWVYVSEDFDVKRVIKAIIESISGSCKGSDLLDSLQKQLRELLNGRRYLLVLDDVWDDDQEKWDTLKSVLACGSKGASIIATTRVEKVASIMGTLPPHHLSFLSEEDCWSLFRQRAFGHGNEEHPNLVAIGKEIVKKCGGVPLAAKALGGLLRFKSEEKEWLFIKESEIWNLPHNASSILPALKLSYYSLPFELRQCFAYCAVFPKGFKIEKEKLIHLWMANGYVSSNGKLEVEDVGNGIWNELHWRSFFQDVEKDPHVGGITFKMHDLMHDLAQSVMEDECSMIRVGIRFSRGPNDDPCFMMEPENLNNISKQRVRHVTLVAAVGHLAVFPEALHKFQSLRTILQQYKNPNMNIATDLAEFTCDFTNYGSLRVFDAWGARMKHLSSSIGNSKHLRYLNLSGTLIRTLPKSIGSLHNLQTLNLSKTAIRTMPKSICGLHNLQTLNLFETAIRTLPKSICSLHNLQTLNLNNCYELQRFPKNIKNLRSLRHLYLQHCPKIHDTPPKLGQLTLLKTLSFFSVGKSSGCQLAELQHLDLGGELHIKHLERVRNSMDAKEANLIRKQNLRVLELSWKGTNESATETELQSNVEQLLEGLEPHPNVEELVINNYRGSRFPLWMRDSILKNTVSIVLLNCRNCLVLPALGQLPSLQKLVISGMDYVEYIDSEFSGEGGLIRGFPSLEELRISRFPNLKGLSRQEGSELLPRLRNISIGDCPKLTLPHLSSPESLNVWGCSNAVFGSILNLPRLSSLTVGYNEDLISFPEEMLQNLTALQSLRVEEFSKLKLLPVSLGRLVSLNSLDIEKCHELESLPDLGLRCLKSLRHLKINHCNNLSSLSEGLGHITALENLDISGCPELVTLPESIKHLNSLRSLSISGHPSRWSSKEVIICAKMKTIPETLQHVPALESLDISSYPELTSLPDWLGNLVSLQSLSIGRCPNISSLPHSIQNLTKLQFLNLLRCSPELKRRCQKGNGEDWHKIAHVPNVYDFAKAGMPTGTWI